MTETVVVPVHDINALSTEMLGLLSFNALGDEEFISVLKLLSTETILRMNSKTIIQLLKKIEDVEIYYFAETKVEVKPDRLVHLQALIQYCMNYPLCADGFHYLKKDNEDICEIFNLLTQISAVFFGENKHFEKPELIEKYFGLFNNNFYAPSDEWMLERIKNNTLMLFPGFNSTEHIVNVLMNNAEYGVSFLGKHAYNAMCTFYRRDVTLVLVADAETCQRFGTPYMKRKISPKYLKEHDACTNGRAAFREFRSKVTDKKSFTWDQMITFIKHNDDTKIINEYSGYMDWLVDTYWSEN